MKSFRLYIPEKGSTPPKKSSLKSWIYTTVSLGSLMAVFYVANLYIMDKPEPLPKSLATRDFSMLPFDLLDATEVCKHKANKEHAKKLMLVYVDTHSTRFDVESKMYKIFLKAHIGDRDTYEEAMLYCYVDPQEHVLRHFRTVFHKKKSILTRALNFFKLKD